MINVTQLVVRVNKTTIEWLERQGYKNPSELPNNSYRLNAFVVDIPSKCIIGTTASAMGICINRGNKPVVLDFKQLKEKLRYK